MAGQQIDLGTDDGIIELVIDGQTFPLDLEETKAKITEFHRSREGVPDSQYTAELVELVQSLGLPTVSGRMAVKVVEAVRVAHERVKAFFATAPGSAASTASPPRG